MGLFSNKDKPCPICGGATPRLLSTKIQGAAICNKCADNIAADDDLVKSWSLDSLKEHLRYRAENQKLVESFAATRTVDYDHEMVIDDTNRMFYIQQLSTDNPPVFRFDEILGYQMQLGDHTVESWSTGMPRTPYRPPSLGLASGLSMLAEAFGSDNRREKDSQYEDLKVILQLNTPYLKEYELCDLSISGKGAAEFEREFSRELAKADVVCNLIVSLVGGGTAPVASVAAAAPSADQAVDNIKKFKELLDAGIITQAEFDAKKQQLLGL